MCAVFSDCLLWLDVCGNVCCVRSINSVFLALGCLLYVCVRGVIDVVFSAFIVTRGTVGYRVWEV